jgi:hypothetical protein
LLIATTGLYEVSLWLSFKVDTLNTLTAVKFSADDTIGSLSPRKISRLSGAANDVGNASGSAIAQLTAGDKMSLWIAASKGVDITIIDSAFHLQLIEEN